MLGEGAEEFESRARTPREAHVGVEENSRSRVPGLADEGRVEEHAVVLRPRRRRRSEKGERSLGVVGGAAAQTRTGFERGAPPGKSWDEEDWIAPVEREQASVNVSEQEPGRGRCPLFEPPFACTGSSSSNPSPLPLMTCRIATREHAIENGRDGLRARGKEARNLPLCPPTIPFPALPHNLLPTLLSSLLHPEYTQPSPHAEGPPPLLDPAPDRAVQAAQQRRLNARSTRRRRDVLTVHRTHSGERQGVLDTVRAVSRPPRVPVL